MRFIGIREMRHEPKYDTFVVSRWERFRAWLLHWNRGAKLARRLWAWLFPPVCYDCEIGEHDECDKPPPLPCGCRKGGHRPLHSH